jgi:hypothetical protein
MGSFLLLYGLSSPHSLRSKRPLIQLKDIKIPRILLKALLDD